MQPAKQYSSLPNLPTVYFPTLSTKIAVLQNYLFFISSKTQKNYNTYKYFFPLEEYAAFSFTTNLAKAIFLKKFLY